MRNPPPVPADRRRLPAALAMLLCATHAVAQSDDDEAARQAAIDEILAEHPLYQNAAPRILQGAKRATERKVDAQDADAAGVLQSGDQASWPRLWRAGDLVVTGALTGTLALFGMRNNAFAPPLALNAQGNPRDPRWGEAFLEPAVTARYAPSPGAHAYGGVSYMETTTRGTDYDGIANTWHGDTELLYGGVHLEDAARKLALDVSYGQQDFAVGDNLLVASGATNGAQRGANYLGPRTAWANATLAKVTLGDWMAQGFWLKPNEAPASATGTRLAGIDLAWSGRGPLQGGFLWLRVPHSDITTRDGLAVYALRASLKPPGLEREVTLQGEYAWQRKSGVSAAGWYVEATWHPTKLPWQPIAMIRYASLSGDRPGAATWEGFDPLYYGGSTPDWYQGKLGSTLFSNTNLNAFAASLTVTPTAHGILQFVYLDFAAAQANAPLEIPAPGGPVPPAGGVPAKALAREFDAIYTHTFSKAVNVNVFAGYAAPGAGYRDLYGANGGAAQGWWMLGTQVNISY